MQGSESGAPVRTPLRALTDSLGVRVLCGVWRPRTPARAVELDAERSSDRFAVFVVGGLDVGASALLVLVDIHGNRLREVIGAELVREPGERRRLVRVRGPGIRPAWRGMGAASAFFLRTRKNAQRAARRCKAAAQAYPLLMVLAVQVACEVLFMARNLKAALAKARVFGVQREACLLPRGLVQLCPLVAPHVTRTLCFAPLCPDGARATQPRLKRARTSDRRDRSRPDVVVMVGTTRMPLR